MVVDVSFFEEYFSPRLRLDDATAEIQNQRTESGLWTVAETCSPAIQFSIEQKGIRGTTDAQLDPIGIRNRDNQLKLCLLLHNLPNAMGQTSSRSGRENWESGMQVHRNGASVINAAGQRQ